MSSSPGRILHSPLNPHLTFSRYLNANAKSFPRTRLATLKKNVSQSFHTQQTPRPFLKWAGGKTQLLPSLINRIPKQYNRYIEPFLGGGALFFHLNPKSSILADLNPELINVYQCVAEDVELVIRNLKFFLNHERDYYNIRNFDFHVLDRYFAAARTIYLNKTCFNGLYRVNKNGHFNTPFGHYKSPCICQMDVLRAASRALQTQSLMCSNYKDVLRTHARPGDLVFLDPPYLPVSRYSDFKRYTKEQFYEEDQRDLAKEVRRLQRMDCHVILTNSNHPLIHELYDGFNIELINTKRNISSKTASRNGEDLVVSFSPSQRFVIRKPPLPLPEQVKKYPSTRFMGSKEKLLPYIKDAVTRFEYESVLDLFSGSGVVSYMFKSLGKEVVSNDYMAMSSCFARAMIENNTEVLNKTDIERLFISNSKADSFVHDTFKGLYFSDDENRLIDTVRANIKMIRNPYKRAVAMSALIRACLKKRPRGIFTYTGHRYNDGRADLKKSLEQHIHSAIAVINDSVFNNGRNNKSHRGDAMSVRERPDLVYIDPPYYSPLSDNEYVRRYHFVEGLACNWEGVDMQWHTKTKKFKSYPTPFNSRTGALDAFDKLFRRLKNSILVISYSSNSQPNREEIISLLARYKQHVEVVHVDYKYTFANQGNKDANNRNQVQEYLFIGF